MPPKPLPTDIRSGPGSADVTIRYCPSCSRPEHGNLACDYPVAYAIDLEQSVALPASLRAERTYRVMDDQLFEVHPGSPPDEDDHCCLCAWRRLSGREKADDPPPAEPDTWESMG